MGLKENNINKKVSRKSKFWEQNEINPFTKENISDELKRYKNKKVISQIYLVNDFGDILGEEISPNESITITELEDKVEIFRYNLDYPQSILGSYVNSIYNNLNEVKLPQITCSGIMPKKEYYDLFNYLEQEKVWQMNLYCDNLDGAVNELLISKNQRKHIIATDSIYRLLFLEMFPDWFKNGVEEVYPSDSEKEIALRFLDISKKIYSISKKYIKLKI